MIARDTKQPGTIPQLRSEELPDLLTVEEVAHYLRKTAGAVRQMLSRGQLRRIVVGSRSIRVHRDDLLAGIRRLDP